MPHFKTWLKITALLFLLEGCGQPKVTVPDYTLYGYEGDIGCVAVHSLFTSIAPVQYDALDCEAKLLNIGAVCIAGVDFNSIQENLDILCTESGQCTYQQQQAVVRLKEALTKLESAAK